MTDKQFDNAVSNIAIAVAVTVFLVALLPIVAIILTWLLFFIEQLIRPALPF